MTGFFTRLNYFNSVVISVLTSFVISSCEYADTATKPVTTSPDYFTASYDITSLPVSNSFGPPDSVGAVQDFALEEISGIAPSSGVPGALWAEEDSGNENKIYLLSSEGKTLANFRMASINDRDWEDLSISSGPLPNVHYLYLAETGDNKHINPTKYIYRFPEPQLSGQNFPIESEIAAVETIAFQYPDGIKNTEAVMVDPTTNDIYIISKEGQAVIYVARYPQPLNKVFTISKLGTIPISDVTAADISQDGNEILIKNYSLVLYWKRPSDKSVTEILQEKPIRVPYQPELKGESICWAADGSGYSVTSEGADQPIWFYKRK